MTVAANPSASVKGAATSGVPGQPATTKAGNLSPLDEERVAALLNLNALILRELQHLQSIGAAAPPVQASPQQQNASIQQKTPEVVGEAQKSPTQSSSTPNTTTPTPQTPKITKPPPKAIYDHYLKRLQVNIAYLLALSGGRPVPAHPGAMEAPHDSWFQPSPGEAAADDAEEKGKETAKQFKDGYQKLRDLWPNYKRVVRPPPVSTGQQQQQPPPPSPPVSLHHQSPRQNQLHVEQASSRASQAGQTSQSTQEQTPVQSQPQTQPQL